MLDLKPERAEAAAAEVRAQFAGAQVEAVYHCPHHPKGKVPELAVDCDCRKPEPGLLFQIQERYGVSLTGVPYVGDSLRDMQAAETVGCVPHLVRTGRYPDVTALTLPPAFPVGTQVHADLAAFVDHLLGEAAAVRALS